MLRAPFLLGLISGGALIYWFTGPSLQAVVTGADRTVELIKANMKLDSGATKAGRQARAGQPLRRDSVAADAVRPP